MAERLASLPCYECEGGRVTDSGDPEYPGLACDRCGTEYLPQSQASKQANGQMMVAHGDGSETTLHPLGQVCAKCRPPVEITDEMVLAAGAAFLNNRMASDPVPSATSLKRMIRAALEAAING